MNNELRIKPLMQYSVRRVYDAYGEPDVFTADDMIRDDRDLLFYRTGNLIRAYYDASAVDVVVTPADAIEQR